MKKLIVFVVTFCIVPFALIAAVPQQITYQGFLTDPSGQPVDTLVSVTLRFYNVNTGGIAQWTFTQNPCTVRTGVFNCVVPVSQVLFADSSLWAGVTIGSNSEMIPRTRIVSSGYAHTVGTVNGASGGTIYGDLIVTTKLCVGNGTTNSGIDAFAVGIQNSATADQSSVTGGAHNSSTAARAFIGGGWDNTASGYESVVTGGRWNQATASHSFVGGGVGNQSQGSGSAILGGRNNLARGGYSVIGGGGGDWEVDSNSAVGAYSAILGGHWNSARDSFAVVVGGENNSAEFAAFVGGGMHNEAAGTEAVVVGGHDNGVDADYGTIGGGQLNAVGSTWGTVGGGYYNTAGWTASTVSGGYQNNATGEYGFVGGGRDNRAGNQAATVGGGQDNVASGDHSAIAGGGFNRVADGYSSVGGGRQNFVHGSYSFIGGGGGIAADSNSISAGTAHSAILCGRSHVISGNLSSIGGGLENRITGQESVIGGGTLNYISSAYSTVSGGRYDSVTAIYGTVPGGRGNRAAGDYSFAAGRRAKANHTGSFVWGDSHDGDVSSDSANSFTVRASGGIQMYTNTARTAGVQVYAGSSVWVAVSDSTKKRNIRLVNTTDILDRVSKLPIKQWSYKSQDPSVEHIGPMAQDFWNLFHIGDDSLSISTIDPNGIALAAIQELAKQNEDLRTTVRRYGDEMNELRRQIQTLLAKDQRTQLNEE